jgi:hypothetical protein
MRLDAGNVHNTGEDILSVMLGLPTASTKIW